jgi:hypothetical protein
MAASPHPSRNLALVAIVVVTAVIVAVLLGLGSDDSADTTVATRPLPTTTTTAPPTTSTTTLPAPTTTIPLPEGDYTALCAQLQDLVQRYGSSVEPEQFPAVLAGLDFDALITASPEGFRVYLVTLRDQRQQVLDLLAGAPVPGAVPASALPADFLDAFRRLFAVAVQECALAD